MESTYYRKDTKNYKLDGDLVYEHNPGTDFDDDQKPQQSKAEQRLVEVYNRPQDDSIRSNRGVTDQMASLAPA